MSVNATAAAEALHREVQRRNEWYGLDNWTFNEVVDFVLKAAGVEAEPAAHDSYPPLPPLDER